MRAVDKRQVLTAIILAGGKATRMGCYDKSLLKIGKKTIIDMQLNALKKLFKEIIIVGKFRQLSFPRKRESREGFFRFPLEDCGNDTVIAKEIKLTPDIIPDSGPLGGIYSGLRYSKSFYNFVIACDMPFINLELIKYMCKNISGYDAVVPKINNRYEPLFCIYSKDCLENIKGMLVKKKFKINELFPKVKSRVINKKEILKFGPPEKIFMNINTTADLVYSRCHSRESGNPGKAFLDSR